MRHAVKASVRSRVIFIIARGGRGMKECASRSFVVSWRLGRPPLGCRLDRGIDHAGSNNSLLLWLLLNRIPRRRILRNLIFVIRRLNRLDPALNISFEPISILIPQLEHVSQCMRVALLITRLARCYTLTVQRGQAKRRGTEEGIKFIFGSSQMGGSAKGGRFFLPQACAEVGEIHSLCCNSWRD